MGWPPLVAPLIPPAKRGGNRRHVNLREVVNGLTYILSTGCQWRAIPKDLPPRSTLLLGHSRRLGRVPSLSGVTQQSEVRRALRHFGVAPLSDKVRRSNIGCLSNPDALAVPQLYWLRLDLTDNAWRAIGFWCPTPSGCDHLLLRHRHCIKEGLPWRFAEAPSPLMWPFLIIFSNPKVKIGLQLVD
jgi:transposase